MRKILIGAAMLAGATLASLPAVAAPPPPPHVQFGFNFGYPPEGPPPDSYGPSSDECLSTGEILADIRSMGYRSVRILNDDGDTTTVGARLGYRRYILRVDDCSGDLVSRRRVY